MISSASGFSIGSSDAIDERFIIAKADMPGINENVYPDVYFAICPTDGNFYIFNKSNTSDETYGKFRKVGSFSDFEETTTIEKLNSMIINQSGNWKQITLENALKGLAASAIDGNTGMPVSDTAILNSIGAENGIASLDANGKLKSDQLPTSAREIVGYLDASVDHELPSESDYDNGNEILITAAGYILQSTAFTLKAGKTLTNLEVQNANTLIGYGYVFTLTSGETSLGTVSTFATDKVTMLDGTEISLPYESDLTSSSTPETVQVTVSEGDSIMLIDKHWIHLGGSSAAVSSVNGKTGAVILSASDVGAVGTDSVVTEFSETTTDTNVPSEKLVKDSLDSKADSSLVDGYAGEDWIFTLSTGSTVTKTVFCK